MIRRTIKIQLGAFLVITFLGVAYLGLDLIGVQTFRRPHTVRAQFRTSGGIFTNAQVTYRGVGVGRVGALRLLPDGVEVELKIDQGKNVPRDTIAVVANKSAVGEQYVDLQPRSSGAPYLRGGDVIRMSDTRVPVDINKVVVDLDRLARSIDLAALQTLIAELGDAFDGTGPALRQLVESGNKLTDTLTETLPQQIQLIREGRQVLQTARETSADFRRFADGLADLTAAFRSVDPDLRALLDNGVSAARTLDEFLEPTQAALHVLLTDLVTINELQVERLDGVRQTLVSLPLLARIGQIPLIDGQLRNGLVSEREAPACHYPETERRLPRDYSPQEPSTDAQCPEGTSGQRGAESVHDRRGGGEPGGVPASTPAGTSRGGESGAASARARRDAPAALGWTGGQRELLGEQSWLALLLALIQAP